MTDDPFSHEAVEKYALEEEEKVHLARWFSKGLDTQSIGLLEFAALNKSCERWANLYGIKIVASMSRRGILEAGANPYETFRNLLLDLEEKDQRIRELEQKLEQEKKSTNSPQRQDSLTAQLRDVRVAANKIGCYDAADAIRNVFFEDE